MGAVPVEEQISHYRRRPPSCLTGLRPTTVDLDEFQFDGHGEAVNAIFAIACACGSTRFTATAHVPEEDSWPEPPVTLSCAACNTSYEVFDAAKHGYDGVLDNSEFDTVGTAREITRNSCEIIARFEYPSDLLGDDEFKEIEHDLFSWITIVGRDPDSRELVTLFDFECA